MVQERGATAQSVETLLAFDRMKQLHVDVVAYPLAEENAREIIRKFPEYNGKYEGHVKIGGYKIILDGSPQGKTSGGKKKGSAPGNDTLSNCKKRSIRENGRVEDDRFYIHRSCLFLGRCSQKESGG